MKKIKIKVTRKKGMNCNMVIKLMNKKYKDNKCKNCGEPCWGSSIVCGLCYVKIFKNNKKNAYINFLNDLNAKQKK